MPGLELTIERIVAGGLGLGQVEGKRALVPLVAPGERVRVEPTEEHRSYFRARPVEILEPHPRRREPPCPYFGDCGGCDLQFLPHEDQLVAKRGIVLDVFRRVGRMEVEDVLPAPDPVCSEFEYRNRIRLSYAPGGKIGLVRRASNQVIAIDRCLLMPEGWNRSALPWLRSLPTADKASFRLDTDGRMIAAITGRPGLRGRLTKRMAMLEKGEPAFPGCLGVLFNAKPIRGSAEFQLNLCGHRFRVNAASFFQVNYAGAEKLIETVRRSLRGSAGGILVDLYAGVGTFAVAFHDAFERVVGMEIARSAVRDFRRNVERNGVENVEISEGAVEKVLPTATSSLGSGERVTVLADPPRTGLEEKATRALESLRPHRIVYVSCDPATLARDVARLTAAGYTLESLEIVDLFPQTAHIECVAALAHTATQAE